MKPFTIPSGLARDLREASFEEREAVMPLLRSAYAEHCRRHGTRPRSAVAIARAAAAPVPAPPTNADVNARVRQLVGQQAPAVAPSSPAARSSLIQRMRAAIAPPRHTTRARVAGSGVPQPPSVNDRITRGVW